MDLTLKSWKNFLYYEEKNNQRRKSRVAACSQFGFVYKEILPLCQMKTSSVSQDSILFVSRISLIRKGGGQSAWQKIDIIELSILYNSNSNIILNNFYLF